MLPLLYAALQVRPTLLVLAAYAKAFRLMLLPAASIGDLHNPSERELQGRLPSHLFCCTLASSDSQRFISLLSASPLASTTLWKGHVLPFPLAYLSAVY
jgi:hypothetical protein